MVDRGIHHLLKQVIDSPVKLHLLLIWHEHPYLDVTARRMTEQTCRDIWSVAQALRELADAGVLAVTTQNGSEPTYRYQPRPMYIEPIEQLVSRYNDPAQRRTLRDLMREFAQMAALHRVPNAHTAVL